MNTGSSIKHLPYTVNESEDRNHYYENYWKRVALQLLAKHAGRLNGMTLLDFGCGRGETMQYARDAGMLPAGLDTDPTCVALASRFGNTQELDLQRTAEQVGVNSFDVVACFHVLEHVDNPKETLSMLATAARKYVLTAVPNLQKIPNLRRPWANPPETNEGHLQSWDHSHFRNLAEKHCGLRLVSWGFDATQFPVVSEVVSRAFGPRMAIRLETGFLRWLFPYWGISVIGLWKKA